MPKDWKWVNVVPIFKKGKGRTRVTICVSLLVFVLLSKALEVDFVKHKIFGHIYLNVQVKIPKPCMNKLCH